MVPAVLVCVHLFIFLIILNNRFSKYFIRINSGVSNNVYPGQANLDPNWLQRSSEDDICG